MFLHFGLGLRPFTGSKQMPEILVLVRLAHASGQLEAASVEV